MTDTAALALRSFSIALFDLGAAWACGLLLAARWLRGRNAGIRIPQMGLAAAAMAAALVLQFYVLVASMTDQAGFAAVLRGAPGVASTHAGAMALGTLALACVLGLAVRLQWGTIPAAVIAACILALHAATGHAADDGSFSWKEMLQFAHLCGMALWTGGVIVSGLAVAPRLAARPAGVDVGYVQALSSVSTWALALVLLTGALKGWSGLEGHLGGLLHTGWGRILTAKLLFVGLAVALGGLHRRWLGMRSAQWSTKETRAFLWTMRMEAFSLSIAIALSAWLASVDPGGS